MADILDLRKALHTLIDPLWQSGTVSRDSVYRKLSELLGKEAHVANMCEEEIKTCILHILDETSQLYPCHKCKFKIADRFYIPVCSIKMKRGVNACNKFKLKRFV